LSTLSWLTYDPAVQVFLERQPDLLELVRRHTAAVKAAGGTAPGRRRRR
jgi:hypothetical protein